MAPSISWHAWWEQFLVAAGRTKQLTSSSHRTPQGRRLEGQQSGVVPDPPPPAANAGKRSSTSYEIPITTTTTSSSSSDEAPSVSHPIILSHDSSADESSLTTPCPTKVSHDDASLPLLPPSSSSTSSSPPCPPSAHSPAAGLGLLERRLTLWDLILLGIGASIGSGIFVVTGIAARDAGPAVVLSFLLAGSACVIDALCYAELAARFPGRVGGAYLFAHVALGELAAFCLFCHLMLDYHIGAASIARGLAGYLSSLVEEGFAISLPAVVGPAGLPALGGLLSINAVAPIILGLITALLCRGVRESSRTNAVMTCTKLAIVLLVVLVGSGQVAASNWVPFFPHGIKAVFSSASVVFFSYTGFDAVANTAEESKNPQEDVPRGIMISLGVCAVLYMFVSAVVTGMVPSSDLDPAAPLAVAFAQKGLHFVGKIIDAGAVVGLTTTLLAGLYVQSRLYLALARDGLLPGVVAAVDPRHHTPVRAQVWVGAVAAVLGGMFDVAKLSHILSVGVLVSYSAVCVAVILLRIPPTTMHHEEQWEEEDRSEKQRSNESAAPSPPTSVQDDTSHVPIKGAFESPSVPAVSSSYQLLLAQPPLSIPSHSHSLHARINFPTFPPSSIRLLDPWHEALALVITICILSFSLGLCNRWDLPLWMSSLVSASLVVVAVPLFTRQHYVKPTVFSCPLVPLVPLVGVAFNTYLVAQMHLEAWIRLVVVTILGIFSYATYGQYAEGRT